MLCNCLCIHRSDSGLQCCLAKVHTTEGGVAKTLTTLSMLCRQMVSLSQVLLRPSSTSSLGMRTPPCAALCKSLTASLGLLIRCRLCWYTGRRSTSTCGTKTRMHTSGTKTICYWQVCIRFVLKRYASFAGLCLHCHAAIHILCTLCNAAVQVSRVYIGNSM